MKWLFYTLVLLFASVGLTLFALHNPGYVLISRAPWSVEMPLTVFVVFLVLGAVTFYVIGRAAFRLWNIPRDVARWRLWRHSRRAQEGLRDGLLHLMEGSWLKAEKRLVSDLRYSEMPLINYLAAACAAQGQGHFEKRDEYLSLAQRSIPRHTLAIGMTQAYLHYSARQYEEALATLAQLRVQEPTRPQVLKLLADVHRALKDWASLAALLPDLRRYKALPGDEIEALELETHKELLILSLPAGSIDVLETAWQFVPKGLRSHPVLTDIYARHLMHQHEMDKAEGLIATTLAKHWHENLVRLYGRVRSANPRAQLRVAESWIPDHRDSAALYLTLGRLALAADAPTEARGYLEQSIELGPLAETYAELGALLERLGDVKAALSCYRRGFESGQQTQTPSRLTANGAH